MAEPKKQSKAFQLYTKYLLQKEAQNPEVENTLNQLKAELNEVHDLDSFIDEIKYRWKGSPWLGGYNKTLNMIFSQPSRYDTFKNLYRDTSKPKFIDPEQFIKPAKKQQGGQLNMNEQELQQAFIQYLAQKTGAKTQQELEAAIQQMGQEGLQREYQEFIQMIQQQQVQIAQRVAKLNYLKQRMGECPEGYERQYYKV